MPVKEIGKTAEVKIKYTPMHILPNYLNQVTGETAEMMFYNFL